jgi:uncharacterized HAD superfamily protein
MDRLKELWLEQLEFNKHFFNSKNMTIKEKQAKMKDMILYLQSEIIEALNEINFKEHRRGDKVVRIDKLTEELIDIQKYLFGVFQLWGVTDEGFYNEFKRKSLVVSQRYKQEMQLSLIKDGNIVGVDLDDILCCWVEGFLAFVSRKTKKDLTHLNFTNLNDTLSEMIGVEKLKKLKHDFRLSDEKKKLNKCYYASEFTNKLKAKGFQIIVLSSRPVSEYPKLYADTLQWLKKNKICYDAVFFSENKEEHIIKEFPKLKFFVEDNVINANKIARKNYKVFLINKHYNVNELTHKNVIRVDDLKEILELTK